MYASPAVLLKGSAGRSGPPRWEGLDPMNSSIIQTVRKVKQGNAKGEHRREGEEHDTET